MRASHFTALLSAGALALLGAPAASADTTISSNWAGYAIHRTGVKFHRISAAWQQPTPHCQRGTRTYSAIWVGLGGYSETSQALEQIGTEVDCHIDGRARSSAWFELVPSASRPIHFPLHPGDHISASVVVSGHTATVSIRDTTSKHAFHRTLHPSLIDVTSADWIVEAPSDCTSMTSCQTLPLANFGSASFTRASVQTVAGHTGTISNPSWTTTKVILRPSSRLLSNSAAAGGATPSPLRAGGSAFSVTYSTASGSAGPSAAARTASTIDGRVVVVSGRA